MTSLDYLVNVLGLEMLTAEPTLERVVLVGDATAKVCVVCEFAAANPQAEGLLSKMVASLGLPSVALLTWRDRTLRKEAVQTLKQLPAKWALGLGSSALDCLKNDATFANDRGQLFESLCGQRALVTFSPEALLAQPESKRLAWEDLKVFKKAIESESPCN